MSKSEGDALVVPFEPQPQITRAIVGKKEIRFELQVPDTVAVPEFVGKLSSSFKREFRANKTGSYGNDPCPVTVTADADDNSKVVATYLLEGWTPRNGMISEALKAQHAFEGAGVRMKGHYDIARGEMDERFEDALSDAFNALEERANGESFSKVEAEVFRRRISREARRSR